MKTELAMKLSEGIHLLHLDGNKYYSNTSLSEVTGVSVSTIKRNRDTIKLLDVALYLTEVDNEVQ
jgi:transcriptional antiterminator